MKITEKKIYIFLFFVSFIFVDFIRRFIIYNFLRIEYNTLGYINYLFLIAFTIIFIYNIKFKRYDLRILFLWASIELLFLINFINTGFSSEKYITHQIFILIPILLVGLRISGSSFEYIFFKSIKLLNFLVYIIVLLGIIDFITQKGIQFMLGNINYFESMFNIELLQPLIVYRYVSFYGHPLRVAQLILIFYILNSIKYRYFNKSNNMILISIVSLIGVILTSSKAGIILLMILFITNINIYNKKYIKIMSNLIIFLGIIIILQSNFFKKVFLERLIGIDFSSGRNDVFTAILNGIIPFPTLLGNGVDYTSYLLNMLMNSNIASFEYPLLIFGYEYGIISTIILCVVFFKSFFSIFCKRQFYILIYFGVITAFIHIYNGITVAGDYMIQYCYIIMLFNNLSIYLWRNNEKDIICN